jgi:hypothetical protein
MRKPVLEIRLLFFINGVQIIEAIPLTRNQGINSDSESTNISDMQRWKQDWKAAQDIATVLKSQAASLPGKAFGVVRMRCASIVIWLTYVATSLVES